MMHYEIVNLSEKTIAGFSARTSNASPAMGQVIGGLWQKLYAPDGCLRLKNRVNDKALGVYTDYADDEKAEYTAIAACEVNSMDIPDGFTLRKIPAGTYAKFIIHGNMITAVQQFWTELWKMPLNRSFLCDFEEYQNADPEHAEIHIYIGIRS